MRVLLADGQMKVRSALRLLLEEEPGLRLVGEAAEAEGLLVQVKMTVPDLLLLDWELPGLCATDLLLALRARCPQMKIMALSGRPEARPAALAAGADVFVSKGDPPERLLAAVGDLQRHICQYGEAGAWERSLTGKDGYIHDPLASQLLAEERMKDMARGVDKVRPIWVDQGPRRVGEWRQSVALILGSLASFVIRLRSL